MSLLTAVSPVSGCQCCLDDGWCVAIILWLPDIASWPVCWQLYSIYSIYLLLLLISSVVSTVCRHTNNCAKRRTVGPGAGACSDINLPHTTALQEVRLRQNERVSEYINCRYSLFVDIVYLLGIYTMHWTAPVMVMAAQPRCSPAVALPPPTAPSSVLQPRDGHIVIIMWRMWICNNTLAGTLGQLLITTPYYANIWNTRMIFIRKQSCVSSIIT